MIEEKRETPTCICLHVWPHGYWKKVHKGTGGRTEDHVIMSAGSFLKSHLPYSEMRLSCTYQLSQKPLLIQCLQSEHEFSTSVNMLRPVCWKWDYLLCHFATSDTIKHHQGLSKLWGRDESFTTDMAVIQCAFTGRLCMALSAGSQGNDAIVVVGQSFPVAFSYVIFP